MKKKPGRPAIVSFATTDQIAAIIDAEAEKRGWSRSTIGHFILQQWVAALQV